MIRLIAWIVAIALAIALLGLVFDADTPPAPNPTHEVDE